jgi:hypothetical protein
MKRDHGEQKGVVVPALLFGVAVAAGYVVWRVAAHRIHLHNDVAVALGLAVFVCGAAVSAFAGGGARAGGFVLAVAALVVALMGLGWLAHLYWFRAVDSPGLTASWTIVGVGALSLAERLTRRVRS